jgi:polyphosphate kinase
VLFPIEDPMMLKYLRDDILETLWIDTEQARELSPDGVYYCNLPAPDEALFNSQAAFLRNRNI